jgi:tRNA threonylcarbamoyladenosine biosynthesis protein TsaB
MRDPVRVTAVLGFDTATADTAVALVRAGEVAAESVRGPDPGSGRPAHAGALLVAIDAAVAAAGGWAAVDRIAVGIGPGSFTGLRVGIAAARALARGRGLPLVGVGTLAVLADGLLALDRGPDAPGALALAVIDARRGQAFAALYGPGGNEVWSPFVAGGDELRERVAGLPSAPVAGGDGSLRFRLQLEGAGAVVADAESPVHRVSARRLCVLGAAAAVTRPDGVQPIYLRRPDAEIWRERQRGGSRG